MRRGARPSTGCPGNHETAISPGHSEFRQRGTAGVGGPVSRRGVPHRAEGPAPVGPRGSVHSWLTSWVAPVSRGLEYREDKYEQLRFRKIGFKPVVVSLEKTVRVGGATGAAVSDHGEAGGQGNAATGGATTLPGRGLPGPGAAQLLHGGDPNVTHEPAEGECTLDADPGRIELQVDRKVVRKLKVTDAPQTLTFEVPSPNGMRN